ncbi:hypothetical protein HDU81_007602 [Chytriomyces hyalinus]|nr:hypothetical protein HDU81_007602 [Chytriomyces hyalinus]
MRNKSLESLKRERVQIKSATETVAIKNTENPSVDGRQPDFMLAEAIVEVDEEEFEAANAGGGEAVVTDAFDADALDMTA